MARLVDQHGLAPVSRRLGKPASQISDMLAGRKSFGEKIARAMEVAWDSDRPTGWLDSEAASDLRSTDLPAKEPATASNGDWPFVSITREQWKKAPKRTRERIEIYALGALENVAADDEPPPKPAHAKSNAA
ncbi:hypothetical protein [Cupriavidus nantongensis]|uniref:hypothetical protein n=1 Tax=Cupriavidus nantongensis TaxID=1796606 RepID=UPI0012372C33|nr:hypothetical protein [Cupriavidus nantongensis]